VAARAGPRRNRAGRRLRGLVSAGGLRGAGDPGRGRRRTGASHRSRPRGAPVRLRDRGPVRARGGRCGESRRGEGCHLGGQAPRLGRAGARRAAQRRHHAGHRLAVAPAARARPRSRVLPACRGGSRGCRVVPPAERMEREDGRPGGARRALEPAIGGALLAPVAVRYTRGRCRDWRSGGVHHRGVTTQHRRAPGHPQSIDQPLEVRRSEEPE
jgi:hypothetical protein